MLLYKCKLEGYDRIRTRNSPIDIDVISCYCLSGKDYHRDGKSHCVLLNGGAWPCSRVVPFVVCGNSEASLLYSSTCFGPLVKDMVRCDDTINCFDFVHIETDMNTQGIGDSNNTYPFYESVANQFSLYAGNAYKANMMPF